MAHAICNYCDAGCALNIEEVDGEIRLRPLDPNLPAICSKAVRWDEIRSHEGRITKPLENIGERGNPVWKEVSWYEALDKIAERIKAIVNEYGPEAIAFSEHPLNHGFGGVTRRLMNHLNTPNFISPLDLCMGNTAQVHRTTYGWFSSPSWDKADCIVYFGQNRGPNLWPDEFLLLKQAQERGANLIVIDPRETDMSRMADYHLRIDYGTDAALALAWLNVIIEEELYDHDFVEASTVGFDDLRERVREYTPEVVAEICDIAPELIRETARVYAGAEAAIIPWGVTADMQKNSTSLIRCQCILRSICGYLNVSEMVYGPASGIYTKSMLCDFDALPQEKRDLQIGTDSYPLFTFKGASLYEGRMDEAGIDTYQDLLACSAMAHPSSVFAAMRGEGPYPIKGFFSVANNTVMSYANMQGIIDALMSQDLVGVYEVNMTPTAQFADFVLPGDLWMERSIVGPIFDIAPAVTTSMKFADAPDECKDWYFVAKGLADRLGFGDAFPWEDGDALNAFLLDFDGITAEEATESPVIGADAPWAGQFLTPSGKVELKSSVLEALGYDPLPYFEEPCEPGYGADEALRAEYPYIMFAGARELGNYNTNLHQIPFLREMSPDPELYIHPLDAAREGIDGGAWVRVSTLHGSIELKARIDDAQKPGSLRVPHGWWLPESARDLGRGLGKSTLHNDGMLIPDDCWNLDREQGLANLRGGLHAKVEAI